VCKITFDELHSFFRPLSWRRFPCLHQDMEIALYVVHFIDQAHHYEEQI
jgi:hypothetical protein